MNDHRQAFRVTEQLELGVVSIDADDPRGLTEIFGDSPGFALHNRLNALNDGVLDALVRLRRQAPPAAEALDWLNRKIDAIGDALARHLDAVDREHHPLEREASLSSAGIGFSSDEPIARGQRLALWLVLAPEHESLAAFATVSRCRAADGRYVVGAEFDELNPDQHRRLQRHLLNAERRKINKNN